MIELNYISIIVPIHKLNRSYKGGFQQYKKDFPDKISRAILSNGLDDDLLCISVMNPMDANCIIAELESYGLQETEEIRGEKVCKDFCVHDFLERCEYRCEWLVIYDYLAAYLHKKCFWRKDSYFKLMGDLCQVFRQRQSQGHKGVCNTRVTEINAALKSPLEINNELNERNLFFTDNITGQEREVVKSSIVGRDRADALWKKMVPVYEKLAKEGNGEAYNLLGVIFQLEKERAVDYFKSGMENGSACAAFNLAMHANDKEKKFALYLWAFEHNIGTDEHDGVRCVACENLAKMYHSGIGTPPNREEAEKWYREAIASHTKSKSVEDNLIALLFENGKRQEALQLIFKAKDAVRKRISVHNSDKPDANQDRICYWGIPEQTVRLSVITDLYIECINHIEDIENADNWDRLLEGLPDLTLDKDYVLDDFRSSEETNSVLRLYARKRSHPRPSDECFKRFFRKQIDPLDVFQHITLPFTEEAIWQAFLLSQTYHLVGMRWHGGYEARTFIVSDKDMAGLKPWLSQMKGSLMRFTRLQEQILKMWTSDLCASVSLFDNYAIVTHCWFDNWNGLLQVKWKIKYDVRKKTIVKIEKENEQILLKYHCKIWF